MGINFYIIGIAVAFLLAIWICLIELRLKKIFRGAKAKDLEEVILSIKKRLENLQDSRQETEKYLENIESRLRQSVQKVGMVRFNPFEDTGSNQSFVIALLDEKGNGATIAGLYGREGMRVYAKPIKNFSSEYTLSPEEKEAIGRAKLGNS